MDPKNQPEAMRCPGNPQDIFLQKGQMVCSFYTKTVNICFNMLLPIQAMIKCELIASDLLFILHGKRLHGVKT